MNLTRRKNANGICKNQKELNKLYQEELILSVQNPVTASDIAKIIELTFAMAKTNGIPRSAIHEVMLSETIKNGAYGRYIQK